MFFEKYDVNLINKSDKELAEFLKKIGIEFQITDQSSRYCAWAIYEGINKLHLTKTEACSFGYMVSTFYGGMGLSCGTDYLYKEENIEYALIDKLNELKDIKDINKKAELFYQEICDLYHDDLDEYAYHRERINIMISNDTLERFQEVEGATRNDKLVNLIKYYNS